jgi:hypothetical protein
MSNADRKSMKPDVRPVLSPDRDHLDSWKEIAAYLRREVRTAQRWERREGLPIHRHSHAKGSSVWAYKHEMDAWLDSRDRDASEAAPKEECSESAAESLNATPLTAARMPAKSPSWLQNAAARIGSLDLLQGKNRIRLHFYVQFRAEQEEQDVNASLRNLTNRGGSVN